MLADDSWVLSLRVFSLMAHEYQGAGGTSSMCLVEGLSVSLPEDVGSCCVLDGVC